MSYLEEAAALLRKASEMNEFKNRDDGCYFRRGALIEGRERIAMKFAQLGAIENGVFPTELAAELVRDLRNGAS
jgi:hypothetical protein